MDEALHGVNLFKEGDKQAGKFSGGMKRRLSVAISLIGSPRVVFLDEPSTVREGGRGRDRKVGGTGGQRREREEGEGRGGDKQAGKFFWGMKRRLSVAFSLIASPRVVFLDDETLGGVGRVQAGGHIFRSYT